MVIGGLDDILILFPILVRHFFMFAAKLIVCV